MRDKSRIRTTPNRSAADRTLDQAIQRVYKVYGPDLSQFFAAVQKQREAEQLREATELREETGRKRA